MIAYMNMAMGTLKSLLSESGPSRKKSKKKKKRASVPSAVARSTTPQRVSSLLFIASRSTRNAAFRALVVQTKCLHTTRPASLCVWMEVTPFWEIKRVVNATCVKRPNVLAVASLSARMVFTAPAMATTSTFAHVANEFTSQSCTVQWPKTKPALFWQCTRQK